MEEQSQYLTPFEQKLLSKRLQADLCSKFRLCIQGDEERSQARIYQSLEQNSHQEKANQNKFQILVEKTTAILFILQERQICYLNPVAEAVTGYSRSQLSKSGDFYQQLNPKGWEPDDLKQENSQELKIVSKNGQEYWLDCCFKTIKLDNKPAIMITAFDVTKYKQAVAKIHQAFTAEKQNNQSKAHFVSIVSHEFRTPLNIISFSTSLLKRHLQQWSKEKQLDYIDRLQTAVEQLSHLMDEVLTIGKAEAGKLKCDPQLFDLALFCRDLVTEINLTQRNCQKINFINSLDSETVFADKNLLKSILINLLHNAIKYSPANSIVDFLVFSKNQQIVFKIIDQGIGISVEEQAKIFEPFHRSNNVSEIPGYGLGLAIVKKLVELHGGQIIVESELETGSTFIIIIPHYRLSPDSTNPDFRYRSS